jgi:hypothetical protein
MEFFAGQHLDPGLDAETLVPHDALEERVDKADDHRGGNQLRPKARPLRNATGNDGRNGRGEGEQKEELHQLVAVLGRQLLGAHEEARAIGHAIAHQKIGHGGDRKVHQDLDQGIHLVLFADRAQLEKGKTRVHGQHHDAAEQNEQRVRALF